MTEPTREQVIAFVQGLRDEIHKAKEELKDKELIYKAAKIKHDGIISDIQKRCPHFETEYYGDPSGNNDSHYQCKLCGKEAKRL